MPFLCQGLPASPALCQDLPPSAPNAENPPSEPGSGSISPAPAPRLRAPRPQRARDPRAPSPARGSEPGGAGPVLRSIPSARPSRAGRAAPSPLAARAVQRPRSPRLSALHPEVRALRWLLRAPRAREAPAPRSSPAACDRRRGPPPYSLPGRSWGRREGLRRPQPPPPPPARPPRLRRRQQRPLRPWSRPRGERSQAPGTRSEPAPGARARGRESARAQGAGRGAGARRQHERAAGGGASAAPGRGRAGGPSSLRAPPPAAGRDPPPSSPGGSGSAGETCPLRASLAGWRRAAEVRLSFTGICPASWMSARRDYKVKNAKNHPHESFICASSARYCPE